MIQKASEWKGLNTSTGISGARTSLLNVSGYIKVRLKDNLIRLNYVKEMGGSKVTGDWTQQHFHIA